MPAFTAALADWCREHHGVVATSELTELDVTPAHRRALLDQGVLVPLHDGVYRLASAPLTFESACRAACAADPSLVVSCTSAGRLWDLRRCSTDRVHVTTGRTAKPVVASSLVLHRTRDLPAGEVVERPDGIRVTSPPRTVFDLARHLRPIDLESVVEQVLDRGLCTLPTLHQVGRRLFAPGRPGSVRFAELLGSRPMWRQPMDSHLEVLLFDALRRAGLRDLVTQPEVRLPDGSIIHPDLGDVRIGWFVEVDHVTWHGGRVDAQLDKRRDRQLRLAGFWIERITDDEIHRDLRRVVTELAASHALCADSRR